MALAGHSLGGAVATYLAGARPDLVAGALLEDPPLYHGDREFFATTIFPKVFETMRDTMRRLHDEGAGRDEVRAMLLAQPTVTGGDLADEATPATIESRVDAFLACDPSVFDPAITGDAIGGWDPDTPIPDSVPLTLLRADASAAPGVPSRRRGTVPARRAAHADRRDRRRTPRHPRLRGIDRPVPDRAPLAARARRRPMSRRRPVANVGGEYRKGHDRRRRPLPARPAVLVSRRGGPFEASAPKYQNVPGLLRKHYLLGDEGRVGGGVYIWESRAAAEALYDDAWRAGIEQRYGSPPTIEFFDSPVTVDPDHIEVG